MQKLLIKILCYNNEHLTQSSSRGLGVTLTILILHLSDPPGIPPETVAFPKPAQWLSQHHQRPGRWAQVVFFLSSDHKMKSSQVELQGTNCDAMCKPLERNGKYERSPHPKSKCSQQMSEQNTTVHNQLLFLTSF